MELLRIIAMLLVMMDHAGFMSVGVPTYSQSIDRPIFSIFTFGDMGLSIVCVNVFVLISGWFEIHFKKEKLCELIFQVFFFSTLVFLILILWKPSEYFQLSNLKTWCLLCGVDYWFVKSYIVLFIFSPALNSFVKYSTERELRLFLLSFFIFQTVYAWVSINGASEFSGGYSALSFMGLYLLARYVRLYGYVLGIEKSSAKFFLGIFFLIALFQTILAFVVTRLELPIAGRLFTYTNPLVIIQSLALLLTFTKIKVFHNRMINWIASSCFAVYLFHANDFVLRAYYAKFINYLFLQYPYALFGLFTLIFIFVVFCISVLLDKIRIYFWFKIISFFSRV
jgi:hypothetical protein